MERTVINKLSLGTVFKITFIGLAFGLVPIFALMGVLSLFGMATVTWNEQPVTGISGLISAPFIGLFVALVFTAVLGLAMGLGLFIYSKFRNLEIEYEATGA
jgi:hypothetical protein